MQSHDKPFKFTLNYQDHLTKFVQLCPLQTMRADEVAGQVLNILLSRLDERDLRKLVLTNFGF